MERPGTWFERMKDKAESKLRDEVKDLKQAGKSLQSAVSDLKDVARGEKDLKTFALEQRPILQGALRANFGPRWYRMIYDDNVARPAFSMAYTRMPLAWFVPADRFIDFCMTHRDTLLGARELRLGALRTTIESVSRSPRQQKTLAASIARAHDTTVEDERVQSDAVLAVKYVESIPDVMASTATAARAAGQFDALFPVLQELEYQFLDTRDETPAELPAILDTSYLGLSLIQTLSNRSIDQELGPLIDIDLRPANTMVAGMLGPRAADLDTRIGTIIDESDLMKRVGKVVGVAIPVLSVAAMLMVAPGASGEVADGGGGADEWVSSEGISASDHAISNAYTGALFGTDCVARF